MGEGRGAIQPLHLGREWEGGRFKFSAFNFFFSTVLLIISASYYPFVYVGGGVLANCVVG